MESTRKRIVRERQERRSVKSLMWKWQPSHSGKASQRMMTSTRPLILKSAESVRSASNVCLRTTATTNAEKVRVERVHVYIHAISRFGFSE